MKTCSTAEPFSISIKLDQRRPPLENFGTIRVTPLPPKSISTLNDFDEGALAPAVWELAGW